MDKPYRPTPSQMAAVDQALADSGETLNALIRMHRDKVAELGDRHVAIIGLTAYLVSSDEEEFNPNLIAQYLAQAVDRLEQLQPDV